MIVLALNADHSLTRRALFDGRLGLTEKTEFGHGKSSAFSMARVACPTKLIQ